MSIGDLGVLPPELIRQICYNLNLDDIINLQKCHHFLELMIDNVFFVDMKTLEASCDAHGTVVGLSAPSTSTQFSTSTASDSWKEALYKSRKVSKLSIRRTEDARDSYVLDVVERAELNLDEVEIVLLPGSQTSSQHSKSKIYPKLTEFIASSCRSVTRFRLEYDPSNSIEYTLQGTNATLIYSQDDDSLLQQQFVVPLFHALNEGRRCPSTLTLRIGWREKPVMALQAAFHAALPRSQRSKLQVLRLDFCNNVSTLSRDEIQQILAQYAPYLNDTRQLQHLILDLSHSKVGFSLGVGTRDAVLDNLPGTPTNPPDLALHLGILAEGHVAQKQKHTNRVACS
ncbi:hypothetical protein Aduo_002434 [Ancylostoma duodenale]